ncbi:MAG: ATP-dependent helicase, RecQ family [Bacteroidetes bacterium]|nr:ATP-dependent helicase, RecQ family [Bacteroidota bacterium]
MLQHKPAETLKQYWGFDEFRPMQEDIVRSVLDGHDTLALLPTGGGKSLCFQVPALCMDGLCVVVSPLIALMRDQVQSLNKKGIKAIAIHSGLPHGEVDRLLNAAMFSDLKFLYISPERIGTDEFQARVPNMNVNLIAIDEAHCISQWGYDFRPAYLKIADLRTLIPKAPLIALTATATKPVVIDIQEKLLFKNGKVFQKSFTRHNLSYVVRKAEDKNLQLLDILKKVQGSAIVYVRNRRKTKEIADYLRRNKISADFYHAGLDGDERNKRQAAWVDNKTRVIVCTNAFGMGIDKPDVRVVVHIEPADSIEAYFQEAGRAGRDEQRAYAIQLTVPTDSDDMLESKTKDVPTYPEVREIYDQICGELNIAYDTGAFQTFDFDLSVFSKKHSYSPIKVMQALKLMESQELLQVSDGFQTSPKVKIVVTKDILYKFQVEHRKFEPLIKMILRTCSGVFEDYVSFNETAIAGKLKMSYEGITATLTQLDGLNILSYIPRRDKPQLILQQPRIRKSDLVLDHKFIEARIAGTKERIESVRQYLLNQTVCRSRYLVQYFGEMDAEDCGICDICIGRKKDNLSHQDFETIATRITEFVSEPQTLQSIAEAISVPNERVSEVIKWLADHGRVARTEDGRIYRR